MTLLTGTQALESISEVELFFLQSFSPVSCFSDKSSSCVFPDCGPFCACIASRAPGPRAPDIPLIAILSLDPLGRAVVRLEIFISGPSSILHLESFPVVPRARSVVPAVSPSVPSFLRSSFPSQSKTRLTEAIFPSLSRAMFFFCLTRVLLTFASPRGNLAFFLFTTRAVFSLDLFTGKACDNFAHLSMV